MNILFLTPRDSRKNLGGVEGHVRLLTEELVKRGHQIKELNLDVVDGLNKGPALLRQGRAFRTSIKETPCFARSLLFKLQAWGYLWKNRGLFRWADVIHVHDVFWWIMPFAIINKGPALLQQQGRALKAKVFVTFHGWEGVCPPTRSAVWQKRLAQKLSRGTIGVGSFFEKWYGVETDRVVWGCIGKKIEKVKKKKDVEKRGKRIQIVFLGRLEEVNGAEVVEVLEKIKKIEKKKDVEKRGKVKSEFTFVGEGSYRKQAEKFGKVTGMVKNPQKYLVDADVVITSSYMSMLEAAARGKPIIAIANSELKEDYLNCHPLRKYIKVARNAEELVRIIKGLYKGPALREQQGRALNDLEDAKVWANKQTAEKLADIYEGLWNLR